MCCSGNFGVLAESVSHELSLDGLRVPRPALKPYLGGVSNTLTNMIYDHVNLQYTYNQTYYETLPPTFLQQARYCADRLQSIVLTDSLPFAQSFRRKSIDYKPFISLFNVTNATVTDPEIAGIANYASVVALELSQDSQGQYEVSMKFKNGTEDSQFRQPKMFGKTSITFDGFIQHLFSTTINSTNNRCFSCNQTVLRGYSVFNYSNDPFCERGRLNFKQSSSIICKDISSQRLSV
ncbi:hypothetical protein BDR05DRAFT_985861 [Suillus weaverae]|nr:hypothetical protein BDR05DRAFT_985861 [Suillus weaverae]